MSSSIKFNFPLVIIIISLAITFCSENSQSKLRSLKPNPFLNATTKNSKKLKLHSKLLQTVYSDSFSKNFYYTTLYLGDQKVRQTYIIDTGSSIMSSPCAPCAECGAHKRPFYYDMNHKHKALKCSSRICKLLPANVCQNKDLKFLDGKSCSFNVDRNRDGIKGYYLRDIVYFETDRHLNLSVLKKKVFRSYALPVGCTTAESGKYKELNTDGILGMSNSEKAVPNLLHKLGIINRNLFTLCFGLRGGYMSLGEVDTTYHKSDIINYVPLLESDIYYFVKLNSLKVAGSETSAMKIPLVAKIDTGNSLSYFPSITFKAIISQFKHYCHSGNHTCGNFTYEEDYGYCALGFHMHKSERIILGANFIHGHDIIFNRAEKTLGFVQADCSRGNIIWSRFQTMMGNNVFETTDPIKMDKELHHSESENRFHLGDNNNAETISFIQGHNTELDRKEFSMINFVILLVSIIIVAIVLIIVLFALLCGKKSLKYEKQENEYTPDDQPEEIGNNSGDNESGENKISFEENNNNIENLNKEEKDDDDEDKKE